MQEEIKMMNTLKLKIRTRKNSGMTLIEIMLVLVLLGFVVSFFAKDLFSVFGSGRRKAAKLAIQSIQQSLDLFKLDCNFYPTTEQGLEALGTAPTGGRQCNDYNPKGYFGGKKNVPKDPWGNKFDYESNGSEYTIMSLGADNAKGGEGDDKDISNQDE
jgi:general secretion pathway protein G